jgi:hypothetical protein
MRYQEDQVPFDPSDRLPALFAIFDANLAGEREGIGEGQHRNIKTDPMLSQVDGRLGGIPFEPDQHTIMLLHKRMYGNDCRQAATGGASDFSLPVQGH